MLWFWGGPFLFICNIESSSKSINVLILLDRLLKVIYVSKLFYADIEFCST